MTFKLPYSVLVLGNIFTQDCNEKYGFICTLRDHYSGKAMFHVVHQDVDIQKFNELLEMKELDDILPKYANMVVLGFSLPNISDYAS